MIKLKNSNPDIIIIGAGLFGSMTAKYLRDKGLTVQIIDSVEPMAASKCSFGVWKDGWIGKNIKHQYTDGLVTLQKYAEGINEIEYINMDKKNSIEKLYQVDCKNILNEKFKLGRVASVNNKIVFVDEKKGQIRYEANKAVIVCAGAYTDKILSNYKNQPAIDSYWGITFEVKSKIEMSKIQNWMPYKQKVAVTLPSGIVLFGDGASVKNPKNEDKRVEKTSSRALDHLSEMLGAKARVSIIKINEGLRPYLQKGNLNMVNQHDKNLFSATGGAKNSTVLCSWVAQELYRQMKTNKVV